MNDDKRTMRDRRQSPDPPQPIPPSPSVPPPSPPTNNQEAERHERAMKRIEDLVGNALLARSELLKRMMDPRRDINDDCGFPRSPITPEFFENLYDRGAVSCRAVEVLPLECWQVTPTVYEDDDAETETAFEKAWDDLGKSLNHGEKSFYSDEMGSSVWEYLERLDIVAGIGAYGVMFMGLDDVTVPTDLANPVSSGSRKLMFLRCFPQAQCQVSLVESDPSSPRYGMPLLYNIYFNDPRGIAAPPLQGWNTTLYKVHWTRVIHFADNIRSNEVYGIERMRQICNNLLSLDKLYGGSGEMYWRGAFPGLAVESNPQLGSPGDTDINIQEVKDAIEQYQNTLQRSLLLLGLTVKPLAPQVVDPTPQIAVQIEAVCIKLGIPVRIFKGSERGELASAQDDKNWASRVRRRQANVLTPRLIAPFVNRLINIGVLPEPKQFRVIWPDITTSTDQERINFILGLTQALSTYVSGNVESLIPPKEYWIEVVGLDEKTALALTTAMEEHQSELDDQAKAVADDHGYVKAPPTEPTPSAPSGYVPKHTVEPPPPPVKPSSPSPTTRGTSPTGGRPKT